MRSKITINIDSDLLDIVRQSDSDLDSIIQEALAQFLGVKQLWVKTNTLEPVSSMSPITVPKIGNVTEGSSKIESIESPIEQEESVSKDIEEPIKKKRRRPKAILKIWEKVKGELDVEFTTEDYWDATKKCGYSYKDSARHSTILGHLKLMEETEKIVKISNKPKKYRKLEINGNLSEHKESQELSEEKGYQSQ